MFLLSDLMTWPMACSTNASVFRDPPSTFNGALVQSPCARLWRLWLYGAFYQAQAVQTPAAAWDH
jgi:hypothetical protein